MKDFVAGSLPHSLVLFPVFFVGLWCFICFILSRLGGWYALGRRFRSDRVPDGEALRWQSAQLGGFCNYNRCLNMVISKEGLHLRIWPAFRLGHPPLLIPWEEIQHHRMKRVLWIEQISFEIGDPAIARMTVSKQLSERFPVAREG